MQNHKNASSFTSSLIRMESNVYKVVHCAPPSENNKGIHNGKRPCLQDSESRPSCRVHQPKSNMIVVTLSNSYSIEVIQSPHCIYLDGFSGNKMPYLLPRSSHLTVRRNVFKYKGSKAPGTRGPSCTFCSPLPLSHRHCISG